MSDLLPHGENLRRAVSWISDTRSASPGDSVKDLIDQASKRFDLNPSEEEFLWTTFARKQEPPAGA